MLITGGMRVTGGVRLGGTAGGAAAPVTAMSQLTITGASATYNSVSTAWGYVGPSASLTSPSSAYISIDLTGKTFVTGLRIILQASGGASSNNDGDADSSANSGATVVFDIPAAGINDVLNIWLGPSGPSNSASGNAQQNIYPRSITGITNPLGAQTVTAGQTGYSGNAGYDAAVLKGSSTILGYAEAGGATPNFDAPNSYQSRGYVNTGIVTSVQNYSGPVSPGRGVAPNNSSYPSWNFNVYSDLATCYGKYSSVASNYYGKGGKEAAVYSAGESGFQAFVWVSIL